jgi:Flp pilus assembly protein TadG
MHAITSKPLLAALCRTGKRGWRRLSGTGADAGQALVEFAVITPLLFLFLCGIFEFGNLLLNQIEVQNGVREGARYAALSGCPTDAAIQSKVRTVANNLPITITSSYTPSPCTSCLGVQVPTVTIAGAYTYSAITPVGALFGFFGGTFSNSIGLTSRSTLNNEC